MHPQIVRKPLFTALAGLLAAALAAGCSGPPRITIENASAEFSPALHGEGIVYLTIMNAGGRDTLVAVKADIPGATANVHEMRGPVMVVSKGLAVPAQGMVELGPMGSHIMIENMSKEAREGYRFTLTLVFARSGEKQVELTLKKPSLPVTHEHHH